MIDEDLSLPLTNVNKEPLKFIGGQVGNKNILFEKSLNLLAYSSGYNIFI